MTHNQKAAELQARFAAGLDGYLEKADEASLAQAYELGRRVLAGELGLLELISCHGEALLGALKQRGGPEGMLQAVRAAQVYFVESLSPFQMTHRAFQEANAALHRLNESLESEVKRVAHLLHGEAGQLLVAVYMALDDLGRRLPAAEVKGLDRVRDLLNEVEVQLRRLSHELHPTVLDDLGLFPALEFLAEGFTRRSKVRVKVEGAASERFPPGIESALYRVVQEGLSNVARHAQATRVTIRLERDATAVRCLVEDDGVGFDAAVEIRRRGDRGLGLIGIRERLSPLGGSFKLSTAPGKGTRLQISIPLTS